MMKKIIFLMIAIICVSCTTVGTKFDIDELEEKGTLGKKLYEESELHLIKERDDEAELPDEYYHLTWPLESNEFEYNFKSRNDLLSRLYTLSQKLVNQHQPQLIFGFAQ